MVLKVASNVCAKYTQCVYFAFNMFAGYAVKTDLIPFNSS